MADNKINACIPLRQSQHPPATASHIWELQDHNHGQKLCYFVTSKKTH
jgi:hypothetical protein